VPTKEAHQLRTTRMMRFVPQRILWPWNAMLGRGVALFGHQHAAQYAIEPLLRPTALLRRVNVARIKCSVIRVLGDGKPRRHVCPGLRRKAATSGLRWLFSHSAQYAASRYCALRPCPPYLAVTGAHSGRMADRSASLISVWYP
jgi:hypothetical protein